MVKNKNENLETMWKYLLTNRIQFCSSPVCKSIPWFCIFEKLLVLVKLLGSSTTSMNTMVMGPARLCSIILVTITQAHVMPPPEAQRPGVPWVYFPKSRDPPTPPPGLRFAGHFTDNAVLQKGKSTRATVYGVATGLLLCTLHVTTCRDITCRFLLINCSLHYLFQSII